MNTRYDWHFLTGDKVGVQDVYLDKDWLLLYEVTNEQELVVGILATGSHDILKRQLNRHWRD